VFRNYLATALRNLLRNRLYAGINIVGLAVGFAAALLIALFVRDELSYDQWIPGHERIYRVSDFQTFPGAAPYSEDATLGHAAHWLEADFPEVEAAARLGFSQTETTVTVRAGDREINLEHFYWGDPNVFEVLPLPASAGGLRKALNRPDGVVITESLARRLFSRDAPIGEIIQLNREHNLTVTAVLKDLPTNTHLAIDAVASGLASYSELSKADAATNPNLSGAAYTYIRLAPGASAEQLQAAMPEFIDRHNPIGNASPAGFKKTSDRLHFVILPISAIHLHPAGWRAMKPNGSRETLYAIVAVGLLIVLIAGGNFVNLATARASRRASEVGVRKVSGAAKRHLIVQFLGESILLVGLAAGIAAVGVLSFIARMPDILGWIPSQSLGLALGGGLLASVVAIGSLAGLYPAFVLSAFRPAAVLKSALRMSPGSRTLKSVLVVVQFAALICLVFATITMYRQTHFATVEGLRFEQDQVLLLDTPTCPRTLREQIRNLPGVKAAACSGSMRAGQERGIVVNLADGSPVGLSAHSLEPGALELYGLSPESGRFFSDADTIDSEAARSFGKSIVINEAAIRRLGYASTDESLGRRPFGEEGPEVIGVVPDFTMGSIRERIKPAAFFMGPLRNEPFDTLNIRLSGGDIPETLHAIDTLWRSLGDKPGPMSSRFYDQYARALYSDVLRQGQLFGAFAATALVLALLGLFGLTAYTAEQKTKEIGIRKAMGASRKDVLRLLLLQFIRPVLLANVIAWPTAYFIMRRWLEGFAYHIELEPWMFLAASALAVVIATLTVTGHAVLAARAQPMTALRYE
jgi:putative ABC transport system permease protein